MAVARLAALRPPAGSDGLLYTLERTALTSIVAVNIGGTTTISAWIVPAGEDANPNNWIYYIDNIGLTNRNTFETFKIAVNVGDKLYVKSGTGNVTFFANGIFDVAGRANVTIGGASPESPQIGDVWINDDISPKEIRYWDGFDWLDVGIIGPSNTLTIGTVESAAFGDPAEATITGDSPNQTLNLVLPVGDQGPSNNLTVGTVVAAPFGDPAEVTITGESPEQTINFVLPAGEQGPANNLTLGTVVTSEPGSLAEVTITGESPDQTINFVLPQGEIGPSNELTVGTVTATLPGEDPEVTITGISPAQTINFVLPKGEPGPPNELTVGTVATGEPGTDVVFDISGSYPFQTINVTIPRGDVGESNTLTVGTVSAVGPEGEPDVEITGDAPNQTINFVLQQGPKGDPGSLGTATLNDLNDVDDDMAPTNNSVLTYDEATNRWTSREQPESFADINMIIMGAY